MTKIRKTSAVILSAILISAMMCLSACSGGSSDSVATAATTAAKTAAASTTAAAYEPEENIQEKVDAANSTADAIKEAVRVHIVDMDAMGTGLMFSKDGLITITVNGGEVKASTDEGILKAPAKENNVFNNKLAVKLKNVISEANAAALCYIKSGDCKAVVFYGGGSSMPTGVPTSSDFESGKFSWGGSTSGVTASGEVIGTSPIVSVQNPVTETATASVTATAAETTTTAASPAIDMSKLSGDWKVTTIGGYLLEDYVSISGSSTVGAHIYDDQMLIYSHMFIGEMAGEGAQMLFDITKISDEGFEIENEGYDGTIFVYVDSETSIHLEYYGVEISFSPGSIDLDELYAKIYEDDPSTEKIRDVAGDWTVEKVGNNVLYYPEPLTDMLSRLAGETREIPVNVYIAVPDTIVIDYINTKDGSISTKTGTITYDYGYVVKGIGNNDVYPRFSSNSGQSEMRLEIGYMVYTLYRGETDLYELSNWIADKTRPYTPPLKDGFEWVEAVSCSNNCITGVIRNVSGYSASICSITFNIYDENGYLLTNASDTITNLEDGKEWRFQAYFFDSKATTYEFSSFTAW